jgi:predicted amidohydrolase
MIEPWTATCMQVLNYTVNHASTRDEALEIIHRSIDRWEQLSIGITGGGQARPNTKHQLLLFPEFALQGFPVTETAQEWIDKACFRIPGPETERLQKLAQKLRIFIGANSYEYDPDWPGSYFNCSYLINPSGDLILKYRRINTLHAVSPHDLMDRYLDKYGIEGTFPVAKTEIGNIAMMPCAEVLYPEAARTFMMRGAEVILHPTSDSGAINMWGWESAKQVRAAENMLYFISANAGGAVGGTIPNNFNMGGSKIYNFDGLMLGESGGPGETTMPSAIIDIQALRNARADCEGYNRILSQRHDIYRNVYFAAQFIPPNKYLNESITSRKQVVELLKASYDNAVKNGAVVPP